MTDNMSSQSERSPRSEASASKSTSLDLVLPCLPTDDKIRSWARDTCYSTGISASSHSPPLSTTSSNDTMATHSEAHSDENSLAGSSYEFIDTDEESRDGNATESIASTDFGRPDEVTSLDETEHSGEESGEYEDDDASSSLQEVGHGADVSSLASSKGRTSTIKLEDLDKPLIQAIEFQEPLNLGAETISVKHTVADYTEEQTATALRNMGLQNPPKRLVVTIRQTMTKQGLSTRDPLRILYVGSHAAKQDIIHKIASSVTASVESGNGAKNFRQFPSQLYNVVPVSAFGSEKTPEIELMHSSGYQIKVEDAISACNLKFEDAPEKPDVIKLTLDDNFSYHSVPEGKGFIIEPTWELPHVGIFYCSDNDDTEARRSMSAARTFMGRHNVPSIVISHKQLFDRGYCMSLDQHAIHMCLESRDPNGRGNLIHRRLPIDLASFLNIDARQMNRNLAYITGLHEAFETPTPSASVAKSPDLKKKSHSMSDWVDYMHRQTGPAWMVIVPVVFLSLYTVVLAYLTQPMQYSTPAISINSKAMSPIPRATTPYTLLSSTVESTTASSVVKTTTRTITITHSHSPAPNSLAVMPSKELGDVPSEAQRSNKPFNRSSVCSAQILGDREILIRIPSAMKLAWLLKEALSVNITRGNVSVDTERAFSSNEGIVLLLPKKEAYGVLNVSIVTSKKPRVNETFEVDFGSGLSQTWQSMMNKMSSLFDEDASLADMLAYENMRSLVSKVIEDAQTHSQSAISHIEEARKIAMAHTATTSSRLASLAKGMSLQAVKQSAIISKEITIQYAEMEAKLSKKMKTLESWREPVEDGLLKAQVQSRLLWLRMLGDNSEYQRYQKRAAEEAGLKAIMREMQKHHGTQQEQRAALKQARDKKVRKYKEWKRGR